jgi:hypothetical protein
LIILALVILTFVRNYAFSILILLCVGIYLGMVFIVAMKQGGESRYTDIVEPFYVLATAMACAALIQEMLLFLGRRTKAIRRGHAEGRSAFPT